MKTTALQEKYFNLRDQYRTNMSSGHMGLGTIRSNADIANRVYNIISRKDLLTYPPSDYNYDNYGANKIFRVNNRGLYPEVKMYHNEKPMGDPNKFAKAMVNDKTIVVSDIRLGAINAKADAIADTINRMSRDSDDVIFLGNLLAPDIPKRFDLLLDFMNSLRISRAHLILGNTDAFRIEEYIDFGFSYVTDRAEKTKGKTKLIYTYYPIPVSAGVINIHGHPSDYVWSNMSQKGHFDAHLEWSSNRIKMYTLGDILKKTETPKSYGGDK